MDLNKVKPEAARPALEDRGRAVLRSKEELWASVAAWSALFFVVVVAVSAMGWAYWRGTGTGPLAVFMRRGGVEETAAEGGEPVVRRALPRRAIDGLELGVDGRAGGARLAVVVENMTDARPLSGLAKASLIIEAPVEAGITRFLAVFDSSEAVERIGPIRSARPYYADWAEELGAVLIHVGGSPASLEMLKTGSPRALNQFFWGKYFWRDSGRYAPHNVYSSTELLSDGVSARYGEDEAAELKPWRWRDEAPIEFRPQSPPDIEVRYSTVSYDVAWRYDRDGNDWIRLQSGKPQFDEDGSAVRVKNVVVQFTDIKVIDEVGRRSVRTDGEGRAIIAVDGDAVEGKWRVEGGRTRFFGQSGEEVSFAPGATWIGVVSGGTEVTY
jgi:hypothetical protein